MGNRGRMGTSTTIERAPRRRCQHHWTKWHQAGIFDSSIIRKCTKCSRTETRRPAPTPVE